MERTFVPQKVIFKTEQGKRAERISKVSLFIKEGKREDVWEKEDNQEIRNQDTLAG